jgi:hypothetical protein
MKYRFRATRAFRRGFARLTVQQQRGAREVFLIFNRTRLIRACLPTKSTSFALAMVASFTLPKSRRNFGWCYIEGNTVVTVDIGHDLYR